MSQIDEVKSKVISGIESERKRMNDKYDRNKDKIEQMNNVPSLITELVEIYGNSLEQGDLMKSVLKDYLEADFFKNAHIGRGPNDVINGANNLFFNNEGLSVGFSKSRIKSIKISKNEPLVKPDNNYKRTLTNDTFELLERWGDYKNGDIKHNYIADLYSYIINGKPADLVLNIKTRYSDEIEDFIKNQEVELEKVKAEFKSKENKIKQYEKDKDRVIEIIVSILPDLHEFTKVGWSIYYENIDDEIKNEVRKRFTSNLV